jgi:hypothetical protein
MRLSPDIYIVRSILDWESEYRGKPWNAKFVMSDVWIRRATGWKLVARHSSYPASELARIVNDRYAPARRTADSK